MGERACRVFRAGEAYAGKQGFDYVAGVSAETAGSEAICMHLLTVPPGGRAKAHLHESHETAIYVLSGEVETWWGDRLEHCFTARPGDIVYIPAGVPHLPVNRAKVPASAVIARTDPNEQESVTLLPDFDVLVP